MTMQEPTSTAIINVNPSVDVAVTQLSSEIQSIILFAETRTVTTGDDVILATDDLSLIAKLRKAIETKRTEYVGPINKYVKEVNDYFKTLSEPLETADKTTRKKILGFRAEIERQRIEAKAIEDGKNELARREAVLKGGEITVDLSPVPAPAAQPTTVRTDSATLGTKKLPKFEVVDFTLLPNEYKVVDATKLGKVVRAASGQIVIPGVKIWFEDSLTINTK